MLLARVESSGDEQTIEDAFDTVTGTAIKHIATRDSEGNWQVPMQGHVQFVFSMRSSSAVKKALTLCISIS